MKKTFKIMQNIRNVLNIKYSDKLTFLNNIIPSQKHCIKKVNYDEKSLNLPSYFPELEVLTKISKEIQANKPVLKNYYLVAGQHILNTTGSLLEWIIKELSLPASNIYLIGKSYSTSKNVAYTLEENLQINYQKNSRQIALGGFSDSYDTDITLLWNKLFVRIANELAFNKPIDGIFVLDDGGHLLKKIPADLAYLTDIRGDQIPLIGIEQTSSGISGSKRFPHPIIEVASSAAKQLEAPMVAKLIEELFNDFEKIFYRLNIPKLKANFNNIKSMTIGVVGLGKIGNAVVKYLKKLNYPKLIIFDYDDTKRKNFKTTQVYFAKDLLELIQRSDVILGCTGTDFMNIDKKKLPKCLNAIINNKTIPKILISLSSKDTEFNSLLNHIHQDNCRDITDPLKDLLYPKHDPRVILIGGGTPFNFIPVHTGIKDYSIPLQEIQLVRGLLAAAILQAHNMMNIKTKHGKFNYAGQYKLDPAWQSFVVEAWLEATNQPSINNFKDLNWISRNSGGILWDVYSKKHYFKH